MTYLGLDIGSTSIKGAVLDPDAETVTEIRKEPFPEPLSGLPPLWFEVDPQSVLAVVKRVIEQLLDVAPECRGILFCGQMGGVILTDHAGRPLTNYLSWRDQRTTLPTPQHAAPLFPRWRDEIDDHDFLRCGNELQPGSAASLLAWLNRERILPRDAIPMSLGDFVVGQLCSSSPVMEYTEAIGILDVESRQWHRRLFERLGLNELNWPELTSWKNCVGECTCFGRKIPVYPPVGDHQCALAGVGLEEDQLSINISTGSQVALLTSVWTPGDCQTRCFLDERYLNTVTHIPAGRALNVLVDLLTELSRAECHSPKHAWEYIAEAAAKSVDTDLEIELSFFAGPLGDHGHIGRITTENLSVGSLFRAAFRQMAENFATLAQRLSLPRADVPVVLSGGLAQNIPVLRAFLAEKFPGPQQLCLSTEDTLFGLLSMSKQLSAE